MSGLYPNPSAAAENYHVGDQVKWYVNENEISPYVGRVTQVCPSVQKVWVDFPVGGNQQKDPTELILVTPLVGQSPVTEDTGYSSIEKALSDDTYGTLRSKAVELAKEVVKGKKEKKAAEEEPKDRLVKLASQVAKTFATDVVEKLSGDVLECHKKGLNDVQAYYDIYDRYEKVCSDDFMRNAISKIYSHISQK
jgi:hypothetical protein